MEVKIYAPTGLLREFVLTISTVNAVLPHGIKEAVTPYPPTPFQSLMFYGNDPVDMAPVTDRYFNRQPVSVLVGPQLSRVDIRVVHQLRAIRVDFLPGGIHRLLGVPMHELSDRGFDAGDFFGSEIRSVNDQLRNALTLEEGKNIVEQFLLKKAGKLKPSLPFDAAVKILLKSSGVLSVEETASIACLCLKQFERKCKERIGMNPKMYARILRFSKAYRLREAFPELSWVKIACDASYFDQMHMIRDFKEFAGVNPSVIEQELCATPLRMQRDLQY